MRSKKENILNFLRANAVYFIMSLCIIAIGLSVTLMLANRNNGIEDDLSKPVIENPSEEGNQNGDNQNDGIVYFIMPVANAERVDEYSLTPVFNQTLDRYSTHQAMDFYAPEGTSVLAVYDGTIESVTSTLLQGVTIVIDHGNGLKTTYNSLLDGENVTVGQVVKQGDVIGEVSCSNRQEGYKGSHLCFSATLDGEIIDPADYMIYNEK